MLRMVSVQGLEFGICEIGEKPQLVLQRVAYEYTMM